ncbi:hypothetical protein BDN71DRAFT_1173199 [Pleurotus eryngii]|uniref:Uncharacterized protein n=1 Tax=Pleurotus eryngii TaxID=5323 RepID=A0A9P5ZU73_PLEER|nr:hypothetical protein BDN71DRAFT_1173199 [Pleurotus eryngii]
MTSITEGVNASRLADSVSLFAGYAASFLVHGGDACRHPTFCQATPAYTSRLGLGMLDMQYTRIEPAHQCRPRMPTNELRGSSAQRANVQPRPQRVRQHRCATLGIAQRCLACRFRSVGLTARLTRGAPPLSGHLHQLASPVRRSDNVPAACGAGSARRAPWLGWGWVPAGAIPSSALVFGRGW